MSAREQVREYVQKVLKENKDDTNPVGDADSLVLSGRLSSLDVVDVLTFLEGQFQFEMDPNEFDQAKFDTVDSIVEMLETQTA
jgi:acyl carrier protein